jgi:hypothetical protein
MEPTQKKPWSREALISTASLVFAGVLAVPSLLPWIWVALVAFSAYMGIVAIHKTKSNEYRGCSLAIATLSLVGLLVLLFLFVALGGLRLL